MVVLSATGFGRQTETKSKSRTLKELDFKSVDKTETYKIYVRKVSEGEGLTNWEELGVILVEPGANVEIAVKERRSALAAAVNHQYPAFRILGLGEELQYGVKLQKSDSEETGSSSKGAEETEQGSSEGAEETEQGSSEGAEETEQGSSEGAEETEQSPELDEAEEISLVPDEDVPDVSVLDVSGKLPDETVPATLRAEDGKVSGRRYKRRFF